MVLEAITNRIPILIADIPAFRQFELWEELYCSDANEFALKVKENMHNPERLIIDEEIRNRILESRDVSEIMSKWSGIIRECSENKSHRE